jgi:hypothetical protein
MKKVEGLHAECGGEAFLAIHKNGKFYVFSPNPGNKRWPPPLSDIVSLGHRVYYQCLALTDYQMLTYPLPEIHHPTKLGGAHGEWQEDFEQDSSADH